MYAAKALAKLLERAVIYAKEHSYAYVTPETLLLSACEDDLFFDAVCEAGGDIELLKEDLRGYLKEYVDTGEDDPVFSVDANTALARAQQIAASSGNEAIEVRHLIRAVFLLPECYASYYVKRQGVDETELLGMISFSAETAELPDEGAEPREKEERWKLYAPCLNDRLEGKNPLIGREDELERTIQILCRKEKNNPLHIGEPGVGKTAVTYGLAARIEAGEVPDALSGARIFELDLGGMVAGTQYRGDFEKRLKTVLEEISREEKPIVYIDEIHNLSGTGAVGESSFDAANLLKPYLADGHIRFIGATTFTEYKKYFEKNRSITRRFQNVEITEPTEEETVRILKGLAPAYEAFHGVEYEKDVFAYAVSMSAKHIHERFLPDKAIDLLDEAGAYRKLHPKGKKKQKVDRGVIAQVLTKICRVPVETVKTEDTSVLATLESRIKKQVFGQDEAVSQVVNAVKYSKAGLQDKDAPIANLLFVGPTGVGKTEIARTLAEQLGIKLIRFDMSEYAERHAVAKLIGAPAGYVGYEEGGLLTEEVRKAPHAVVLLDEIEKAHPDIFNILLSVMDYGTLTDNQGRKADFHHVILIMTSNAGASRIGHQGIGFMGKPEDKSAVDEAVKRTFSPEFRNRLHRIVTFNGMDEEMAERIVKKKLKELSGELKKRGVILKTDAAARDIIKTHGISRDFGAREIDRVIRNEVKPLLVDELLFGSLKNGGTVRLSGKGGTLHL